MSYQEYVAVELNQAELAFLLEAVDAIADRAFQCQAPIGPGVIHTLTTAWALSDQLRDSGQKMGWAV